ncbi:RidA family protein [Bordetella tumulicola]|uniref:RidA family protein n=1 Tax=Bordetella tumulicola TaxID=1649133 RepID=UPI0039EFB711
MLVQTLGHAPLSSDGEARPLSPATRAGDFVFVSGQVPLSDAGTIVEGGIAGQTRQVFRRVEAALALADCSLQDVAKITVWLADAGDFAAFNQIYMECFGAHRPARSTVQARLMVDALVEIEVTAYKPAV